MEDDPALASVLGVGYVVKPDIIIARHPLSDRELNKDRSLRECLKSHGFAKLRSINRIMAM